MQFSRSIAKEWLFLHFTEVCFYKDFPGDASGKESSCNAADPGLIAGLERSPAEGNGKPFQSSCLGNPMDSGAWQARVHSVAKESNMT